MISTQRIRCNFCNRRIPASSVVCPSCQRNPRAFYWKRRHVLVLVAVLALVGLGALFVFLNGGGRDLVPASIALVASPTVPTPRPPITVVLVATPLPPTVTDVPPTPTMTATEPPPTTVVPTIPFTATRAPADAASSTPAPTATSSPIPTPVPVESPRLVSPLDGDRISGPNKSVILTFQPAQTIGMTEWYRVQVDFLDRAGNPVSWCGFTKESALEFPRDFFDDSSPNVRSFLWRVNVVSSTELVPVTCDAPYEILSAPSEVWTFYWY
ncbi:MAG: hypothetical protein IT331_15705 [Anaerolineae bacterium]|nr:hypothetical protein [Anaerolineae bacterium]